MTTVNENRQYYSIAEIYISDLKYLRTSLATRGYGSRDMVALLAQKNNAVVAISGDYYSARKEGIIVRNGVLYRDTRFEDVCVLLNDGRMLTLTPGELDLQQLKEAAPWQVWSFGPKLLDNGAAITSFTSAVEKNNPRSAIGYYEPGHYCLVVVDGRQGKYSGGLDMKELSKLMYTLGCVRAYNLDGGATAHMSWLDAVINSPSKERDVHDVICVCFPQGA